MREVKYDAKRWSLLRELRSKAISIMKALKDQQIPSIVYGSIARGDVKPTSDVDVFVPYNVTPFLVESALRNAGFEPIGKEIVQATPSHGLKAYITLEPRVTVSFPLTKLKRRELEFYSFGGKLSLDDLLENKRIPGVDKRLFMIEPTPSGHVEWSIVGREGEAASILGVSLDTVLERVRVLTRRRKVGRTGVFLKWEIPLDKSFEEALRDIVRLRPRTKEKLRG